MSKAYYIRPNHESKQPSRWLISHLMTYSIQEDGIDYLKMNFAYTAYYEVSTNLDVALCDMREWDLEKDYQDYLLSLVRDKAPLLIVSENPALDLWASGMAERLHFSGWEVRRLYHHHQVAIMSFVQGRKTLRFCSLHNWLPGGMDDWAKLVQTEFVPKGTPAGDAWEETGQCREEMKIIALTFLDYLHFLHAHDLGGFALTISGQAMRGYRHRFMPAKILHYDEDAFNEFVRAGYHGGRVECFFIGKWENRSVVRLDVNSMYPAVMRDYDYPIRIRQWVKAPSRIWLENRLAKGCVMARVKIRTDQPIYPYPHLDQLCFPIGEFWTTLCTGSLKTALQRGHLLEIEEAICFHSANLFREWAEYFYSLKLQYEQEGNHLWRAICKAMLNHLYGKFGALYGRELINEPDETHDFFRQVVGIIWKKDGSFAKSERRKLFESVLKPDVVHPGVEWRAFGRHVLTVGTMEAPDSAPAIAAHITDYARLALWEGIEAVGRENMYYCDTDSIVTPFINLSRMEALRDEAALGKWKVELIANDGEIHAAKSYRLGDHTYLAGITQGAVGYADNTYACPQLPGLYSLLRPHSFRGYPLSSVDKRPSGEYTKGMVGPDGRVSPLTLSA